MVYPTSISIKQYRECFKVDKAYTYYGGKTFLSALVDLNPPHLTLRFALVRIARRHTIALNGACDEFLIPLYIISGFSWEETMKMALFLGSFQKAEIHHNGSDRGDTGRFQWRSELATDRFLYAIWVAPI